MQQEQRTCLRIAVIASLCINALSILLLLLRNAPSWFHALGVLFLGPSFLAVMLIWPWPAHDMPMLITSEVLALSLNVLPLYALCRIVRLLIREWPAIAYSPNRNSD